MDLTPSFKTYDERFGGLVLNVDYLENWHFNFIQKKYGRKRHLPHTNFSFSGLIFLLVQTFYTIDDP